MNISSVGSQVSLLFQSKFATFTPAQFVKTFQEQGFIQTRGNANISANPMAQPVLTNIFSKDDLIVLFNPNENIIIFQILNTLDFNDIYEKEIQKILVNLNFNPSSVGMLGIDSSIQVHEVKPPIDSITSLTNKKFVESMKDLGIGEEVNITSLRFNTKGTDKESLSVAIEPLLSNPTGSYHVMVVYRTKENDKFNEFVTKFGTKMIEKIINGVEESA